jgi:threonine/homoserine/homoserine lactone efflux protein
MGSHVAMITPSTANLELFIIAALVLLLTPGQAVLYIVGRSVERRRRAGLVSALGIHAATLVHVLAAALARMLHRFPVLSVCPDDGSSQAAERD